MTEAEKLVEDVREALHCLQIADDYTLDSIARAAISVTLEAVINALLNEDGYPTSASEKIRSLLP